MLKGHTPSSKCNTASKFYITMYNRGVCVCVCVFVCVCVVFMRVWMLRSCTLYVQLIFTQLWHFTFQKDFTILAFLAHTRKARLLSEMYEASKVHSLDDICINIMYKNTTYCVKPFTFKSSVFTKITSYVIWSMCFIKKKWQFF